MENTRLLNRAYSFDIRDYDYLIKRNIATVNRPTALKQRYWNADGWWGDQLGTPQCVGYAWAHWLEDGPVEHAGKAPIVAPELIYTEAQKVDEWAGENYNGTSVRGGAKFLAADKKIGKYYWAFDINTIVNTLLNVGPVVVGTNWYSNMMAPNRAGFITPTGRILGGHAYVLNGVDTVARRIRVKNSWGRKWGQNGHAWISIPYMEKLIRANGEACIAVEFTDEQIAQSVNS